MTKRVLLVLAVLAAFAGVLFAGGKAESTGQTPAGSAGASDGPFGKYDPAITMEWNNLTVRSDQDLAGLKSKTGETFEDNRWTRGYAKDLGINVKYRWWSNNPDQFTQKMKLAMASGDLPDYFQLPILGQTSSGGLIDLRQLALAGQIQDMTAYWQKYAAPLTKEVVEADGTTIYNAVNVNGKMMGIPGPRASLDSYVYMFIRTDWLEKLGLQPPKSMDDLLAISKAFTHDDPDGNGKDDTFGMVLNKGLWNDAGLTGFLWGYKAYPETWIKDANGRLGFGGAQPEMLAGLKALNAMYNDGQIDHEFGVKDIAKATEPIAAGKAGIMFGGHWSPFYLANNVKNDPNAKWGCYAIPGVDGKPATGATKLGLTQVYVAKKGAKNPEAIVKLLNYHMEKLYGPTGDYSYWGNAPEMDGMTFLSVTPSYHPLVNILPFRDIKKVVSGAMKPEDLKGISLNYWNNMRGSDPLVNWTWKKMIDPTDKTSTFSVMDDVILPNHLVYVDNFVGAPTETMIDKWSTLLDLEITSITKMILGSPSDVDSQFAKYIQTWRSTGGDQVTQEVNDWYKSVSK